MNHKDLSEAASACVVADAFLVEAKNIYARSAAIYAEASATYAAAAKAMLIPAYTALSELAGAHGKARDELAIDAAKASVAAKAARTTLAALGPGYESAARDALLTARTLAIAAVAATEARAYEAYVKAAVAVEDAGICEAIAKAAVSDKEAGSCEIYINAARTTVDAKAAFATAKTELAKAYEIADDAYASVEESCSRVVACQNPSLAGE